MGRSRGPQVCSFKTLAPGPQRGREWNRSKWHFLLPRSRNPACAQLNAALADGSPEEALPRRPTRRSGWTEAQISTAAPTRCPLPAGLGLSQLPLLSGPEWRVVPAGTPLRDEDLRERETELDLRWKGFVTLWSWCVPAPTHSYHPPPDLIL